MSLSDPPDLPGHCPPLIPAYLRPVRSLLLAVLAPDGSLMDANEGFRQVLQGSNQGDSAQAVRALFINPTFQALQANATTCDADDAPLRRMTIGGVDGGAETWLGRLCRQGPWLLLLCERDVEQDRALSRQLLELMDDYTAKERELAKANRELDRQRRKAEQLMVTDPLTGMPNRLYFDRILEKECARAQREGTGLGLLVIDIDHFKSINDNHGHEYGDQVLSKLAQVFIEGTRDADFAARWGGEEFVILTSHAHPERARQLAERIRKAVEGLPLPPPAPHVSCSIGVTTFQTGDSPNDLFRRADQALYQAKRTGRNRTVVHRGDEDQASVPAGDDPQPNG